ncbi:cupredoxin domain-containing protein [Actinomadura rugatobispora]|uniref:Plastocyanin/azurin family copper-binding protein n=1 Tax=Actinomadura rugatobispora TaxID=1994 RepID=A0ABW0ZZJ8_9ACTN|nr:cupredoxin family copper-binding protein [Actinomadura rugatobispora]
MAKRIGLVLALGSPSLLAGLLGPAAEPARADTAQVRMQNTAYSPSTLTIRVGDTVTWTNLDQIPHDVVTTSGPQALRSPMLQRGRSWSFTFRVAGTYAYYCSVHPAMRGRIVVQPRAATPAPSGHAGHDPAPSRTARPTASASSTPRDGTSTPAPSTTSTPSAPAAAQPQPAANASAAPGKSVNPLLPIAGLVCAVAVFCLLLLTSPAAGPEHLDD